MLTIRDIDTDAVRGKIIRHHLVPITIPNLDPLIIVIERVIADRIVGTMDHTERGELDALLIVPKQIPFSGIIARLFDPNTIIRTGNIALENPVPMAPIQMDADIVITMDAGVAYRAIIRVP